ncbi:MAG: tripartite tricarboxylate transporter substrate binding protein [Betaproteobacteria bacterium]|nr:tripartite tricarboxylate transporter substrate binding protein [Betaproteobacteria bacterium]
MVENRAGGGGIIGTDAVAKAPADGYTMGVVAKSFTMQPLLQARMPYDVFRDLQPIMIAAWTPHIFVVHPSLPVRSIKDLIEHARANPGKLSFASAGPGTGQHLAGELFKSAVNINLVHIPYQGSAPAVTAMLGGHVGMMIGALPDVLPHVQAGKMRVIAVAMDKRAEAIKDLPAVSEAGVKGFDSWSWFGIVTAAAVPREIVNRISAEMNRQLRAPDARERLDALAL